LSILLTKCSASKTASIEQNFVKKIIEIANENASALHLGELQKYKTKG
jgi:hypothetical protein